MTAEPRLTHSAFVDVVSHVSEIVCLGPGWTQPVLFHPAASRSCRHWMAPTRPECTHPNIVESGL